MRPEPGPKKREPRALAGKPEVKSKESSLTNNDAAILPYSKEEVKRKPSKKLLILRGPLIGVGIHAHCPMCDREHWHEWLKGNADEEVVEAECENSYVKFYRLAPLKPFQMEHMEVIARDMGFNLPLRQIHKTSLALAKEEL
jgi:hypothetical protein